MFEKFKSNKHFRIAVVVIVAAIILFCATIGRNTIYAYKIVKANYYSFNYPSTVRAHSGTVTYGDDWVHFTCELSAENAYGQRIYNYFLASEENLTSFDWYDEYGISVADFMYENAQGKNVSIVLLNFMIWMDWC